MTIEDAKEIIIGFRTLPPQIDNVSIYEDKYYKAMSFLKELPDNKFRAINREINKVVNAYYEPNEDGVSIAYLDSLF